MTAPADVPTVLVDDPFTGTLVEIEQGKAAPLYPPDAWLSQRAADEAASLPAGVSGGPMKLQVYPGGRVAGLVAPTGECLIGAGDGECWTIPRPRDAGTGELSAEHYRAHGGLMKLASGAEVPNGVIGGGKGHASMYASPQNAQEFYADTATQIIRGQYRWSDVAGGLTFVGALWPWVTEEQVAVLKASPASIDYRWIVEEGDYRLVGSCLVNIPGFPARWKAAAVRVASAMIVEPIPVAVDDVGVVIENNTVTAGGLSSAEVASGAIVSAVKESAMQCATCGHQAAPPPPGDHAPPAADKGGDTDARLTALESKVAELEAAVMGAAMAALTIPALPAFA